MADFKRRFKDLLGFGGNESVAYDDSAEDDFDYSDYVKQKIRGGRGEGRICVFCALFCKKCVRYFFVQCELESRRRKSVRRFSRRHFERFLGTEPRAQHGSDI